jgi:hypothetical protein
VRMEELELVCVEAARSLLARDGRPVAPAVVLPLPAATKVTTFPDFPDTDDGRFDLLSRFAAEVMVPAGAPAWGFVAEASAAGGEHESTDVLVVAYGARLHPARITAAPVVGSEVGEFTGSEGLDPTAMPFLSPLQHAADRAAAQEGRVF